MANEAVLDNEAVLERITRDGTFDKLRQKALQELRQHPGLRAKAEEMIRESRLLGDPQFQGPQRQQRLFKELRERLGDRILEEASRAMWEVVTEERYGVTQQLQATVHSTLCRSHEEREEQRQEGEAGRQGGQAAPAQQQQQQQLLQGRQEGGTGGIAARQQL